MDIVRNQANDFFRFSLFSGSKRHTLENLKEKVESELYNFKKERDKVLFLESLRPLVVEDKLKHQKKCNKENCDYDRVRDIATFVIDQESDDIKTSYSYSEEYQKPSSFSPKEESIIIERLNQIDEKLRNLGYGQEIIFQEIDELKLHLNLGKKNWFQLLKGKLFDLGIEKVIEKGIIDETWSTLKEGFEYVHDQIQ